MSWSVSAIGKPAAVKKSLAGQFDQAKKQTARLPHESESVALIEQIVNGQLDYVADLPGVVTQVAAQGSAYKQGTQGNSEVALTVKQIYGFVE